MSVVLDMLVDYVPYAAIAVVVSFVVFLIEERYKVSIPKLFVSALSAALGYRLFSYYPPIGIIAYIAAAYATSSSAMPRSGANIRMAYSIASASAFALVLYFLSAVFY